MRYLLDTNIISGIAKPTPSESLLVSERVVDAIRATASDTDDDIRDMAAFRQRQGAFSGLPARKPCASPVEYVLRGLIAMQSSLNLTSSKEYPMASITIRNLEDDIKRRLRIRAAEHGRSMEEEARDILRHVVTEPAPPRNLAAAIRSRLAPLGGVDLDLPPREAMREPPRFAGKRA